MTGPDVRLGLVGCGRLAVAGYLPALAETPGVRLVAVADPDPARRGALASLAAAAGCGPSARVPVRAFPDAAALLDGAEVDALVLASPAAAHVADAERAAAAGVPTLVEKPPAVDAAGARALAALDPPPRVGFNRRFDPGAGRVRSAVPAGGDLDLRLEIGYRRAGWGAHAVHDDALLDLGPHLIDWARWISGAEVVDVACTELQPERAALDLTLGRGRALLRAATDRPHAELVELRDGSGQALARHRLGGLGAAVRGRLGRSGPTALVHSLAGQLAAFAAAAGPPGSGAPASVPADPAGGPGDPAPALGTAADGLAAMLVVDAARASAADGGRRVPIACAGVR